jgi:hypothetical protein
MSKNRHFSKKESPYKGGFHTTWFLEKATYLQPYSLVTFSYLSPHLGSQGSAHLLAQPPKNATETKLNTIKVVTFFMSTPFSV